jgi:hypothetical protein
MTADSEIEMLLNEQPGDTLTEIKVEPVKIEAEEDRFFEELMELDYALPLVGEGDGEEKFMM